MIYAYICGPMSGLPEYNYPEFHAAAKENDMDEPTCTTTTTGDKLWYVDDRLHRTDGPAIEWADGGKEWHLDGRRHRVDGPAIEWASGITFWYFRDQRFASLEELTDARPLACHEEYTLYQIDPDRFVAGCRRFTRAQAIAHWCSDGRRPPFAEALNKLTTQGE